MLALHMPAVLPCILTVSPSASITRKKIPASRGLVMHAITRILNVRRASVFNILQDDTKSLDKT